MSDGQLAVNGCRLRSRNCCHHSHGDTLFPTTERHLLDEKMANAERDPSKRNICTVGGCRFYVLGDDHLLTILRRHMKRLPLARTQYSNSCGLVLLLSIMQLNSRDHRDQATNTARAPVSVTNAVGSPCGVPLITMEDLATTGVVAKKNSAGRIAGNHCRRLLSGLFDSAVVALSAMTVVGLSCRSLHSEMFPSEGAPVNIVTTVVETVVRAVLSTLWQRLLSL